jgi:hypothetical protein
MVVVLKFSVHGPLPMNAEFEAALAETTRAINHRGIEVDCGQIKWIRESRGNEKVDRRAEI